LILLSITLIGAFAFTSCEKDPEEELKTIVDVAIDNGFNVLAATLTEAGLVDDLEGTGSFTVFAPTDAAFDALYTALGVNGPEDLDDELLVAVLLYHVLGLDAFSTDLVDGLTATTLSSGATFIINISGSDVTITDGAGGTANITSVNILGTNGVIHVIDKVILPAAK